MKSTSPVLLPPEWDPERKEMPPPMASWVLVLNRLTPRPAPAMPSVGSGMCGAPALALLIWSPLAQLARVRQYSGVSPPTLSAGAGTLHPAGPRQEPSAGKTVNGNAVAVVGSYVFGSTLSSATSRDSSTGWVARSPAPL